MDTSTKNVIAGVALIGGALFFGRRSRGLMGLAGTPEEHLALAKEYIQLAKYPRPNMDTSCGVMNFNKLYLNQAYAEAQWTSEKESLVDEIYHLDKALTDLQFKKKCAPRSSPYSV